jgi:hypothetical protein
VCMAATPATRPPPEGGPTAPASCDEAATALATATATHLLAQRRQLAASALHELHGALRCGLGSSSSAGVGGEEPAASTSASSVGPSSRLGPATAHVNELRALVQSLQQLEPRLTAAADVVSAAPGDVGGLMRRRDELLAALEVRGGS